jgi:hypothetical protein
MSVLAVENVRIDPPAVLPVDYLSLSSLKMLMACPEKWRRKNILKEPEPPSGKMVLGSAADAALTQHYGTVIETGEGFSTERVLDEFSTEWEDRISSEEVDWGKDTAGQLKDSGAGALRIYHRLIAPSVKPVAVQHEFELSWPGVQWKLTGFIDLEDADGHVRDYKMTAKRISPAAAAADLQPDVYLVARRAEGDPAAGFLFDTMVRTSQPTAEVVPTERSERQLDRLTDRIFDLAREIAWRFENDVWSGAAPLPVTACSMCRYAGCPLRLGGRPA